MNADRKWTPARRYWLVFACTFLFATAARSAETAAPIYVVLWFDTEDYILPASDDAALHLAEFLTKQKVPATFKVVGEKARTLERRGRQDVIAALRKHEIGFHSNYHRVQPSPALYLSNLGWDEGVAEFERREGPGLESVERIFGVRPSCYGQPGSSWAPQSYGALRKWGIPVYLDGGSHVNLQDRPCYFCGILTLYKLEHVFRTRLDSLQELKPAEDRFLAARKKLQAEGGGVISVYYHPCEFVHKEFWDGVNFRQGANPPREQWKLPAAKSPEEVKTAYEVFEQYIQFIQRFSDVQFITASQAAKVYADRARGRKFSREELKTIADGVRPALTFQQHGDYVLAASEVFALLNANVALRNPATIALENTPLGPSEPSVGMAGEVTTTWSQFQRAAVDVADFLRKQGRVPSAVWLGSVPVPPESYLVALAEVVRERLEGKPAPETVTLRPAQLDAARYVADDAPELWKWVIFPPGFRAPALMALGKRQAWTIKPALLAR